MTRLLDTDSGAVFFGSVDDDDDVMAAAAIAMGCAAFSPDEDDECYVDRDRPSCFNCRGRRWLSAGFSCMRGRLSA